MSLILSLEHLVKNILSKKQAVKKMYIGRTPRICIYAFGPTEVAPAGEIKDNRKFRVREEEA